MLTDLVDQPEPPPAEGTEAIVREVFDLVMQDVEGRLAAEIEHRLARHAAAQVQAAVAGAVAELRTEIANIVDEAVARALARGSVK